MTKEEIVSKFHELVTKDPKMRFLPETNSINKTASDLIKRIVKNYNLDEANNIINICISNYAAIEARDLEENQKKQERRNETLEIKEMIQTVKDSDKPAWEKKILVRLIKDMRD